MTLPLRERRVDLFFAVVFCAFTVTSLISDLLPTIGVDFSRPSGNFFAQSNYWYAHDADPLFMNPPVWMRIVTGLSAFVYMPFYIVLVAALVKGWNAKFLPFNLPYVLIPLLLSVRMRKPMPFTRRF